MTDFRQFVYIVWKHLNLPDPTPLQYDIANYLQHSPERVLIEAFRGIGKSYLCCCLTCFLLLHDPQLKIMIVSASKDRADGFSTFIKRLINEIPILSFLKAKPGQRDSSVSFDVGPSRPDHSPSVKSVGITGQITGSRADIIIADDVEVPNNSATQSMRDKLAEAIKEFDSVLKPGGKIIFLGTPQCEMSLYNSLPEKGYEARIWPAEYPAIRDFDNYKGALAPKIGRALAQDNTLAGEPTEPLRFDREELAKRRRSIGAATYSLQFMLNTSLSDLDRYPLRISDLIVMNLNPIMAPIKIIWAPSPDRVINDVQTIALAGDKYYLPMWVSNELEEYTGAVMAIDPSGRGADETGYAVTKMLAGNLFITAAGGIQGGYDTQTLEELARIAKTQKVKLIRVESNFGDGMFTQLLKPVLSRIYPVMVEEVRSNKQKEARIIDTLEPVMSTHRLIVDKRAIERDAQTAKDVQRSLFYQMTRLTRDRGALPHDDRLDALAMAVDYWKENLDVDNDRMVEKIREQRINDKISSFLDACSSLRGQTDNWLDYAK